MTLRLVPCRGHPRDPRQVGLVPPVMAGLMHDRGVMTGESREGLDVMRMLAIDSIGPSFYPSSLPVGSGNENDNSIADKFYTEPSEEVLSESGGFISIESGTELP